MLAAELSGMSESVLRARAMRMGIADASRMTEKWMARIAKADASHDVKAALIELVKKIRNRL